ncbi:MAG: putative transport system ATP-binding protein [Chloroflexota bacterium]|jgi:putative ABC transport system ATP-binding protein|nr:putative transport system ATP-binding protein [Chloroflexota bacterium]
MTAVQVRPVQAVQSAPVTDRPIVEVSDLIKVYRHGRTETIALRGVDLSIAPGEFVAIQGRSGSGKSTLLNLLSGSDRPTAGRVTIDGIALEQADETQRAQLRGRVVGIVFQSQNLADLLSLEENVALSARLAGRDSGHAAVRARLAEVGLEERATHHPSHLSGGEQQRGGVACVLAALPKLLLGDEITGELDTATAVRLLDLVREVHAKTALTVVLVTHDPLVAERADRVIELRDGRVVSDRRTSWTPS